MTCHLAISFILTSPCRAVFADAFSRDTSAGRFCRILQHEPNCHQPHAPNSFFTAGLADADPEIAKAIELELGRQQHEIELIASENIVSKAVIEAQGSVMTNKYAEGYPGRRYYGGCQFVDMAENLAIERVTRLFDCKFANVQPNSGSQANQAVFLALLQPGDPSWGSISPRAAI